MPSPRDELLIKLRRYESYRKKNEKLFGDGLIVKKDIRIVYETSFLLSFIAFENYIEGQFLYLLTGGKLSNGTVPKHKIQYSNRTIARNFVYSGRSYIDWLPYGNTKKIAKSFFKNGVPFSNIGNSDKNLLTKYHAMRNAIAHQSKHSLKILEEEFTFPSTLRPSEKVPAGFLRSIFSSKSTQYEFMITELERLALLIDR